MRRKIFVFLFILLFVLSGCSKDQNQSKIKPKDKAPESLNNLSKGLDDLLKSVGNIERINLNIPVKDIEEANKPQEPDKKDEEKPSDGGEKPEDEGSNSQGQGDQSGGGSGSQGQGTETQKPTTPEEKKDEEIKALWAEIDKKLEEIHPEWNSFEAEGMKKGASKESTDKFELAFNKMTKAVDNKSILEIYDYASQSLLNLKPLFELYTEEMGGDISVIKYAAYQGYVRAISVDVEGAKKVLSDKEENINKIRLKMTKEEEKQNLEKVSLSLADFRDSLTENSRMLFMIKKDIIIENLKALE